MKFLTTVTMIIALGSLAGCPDGNGDTDANDCVPACGSGYTCVSGACVADDADGSADADADSDGDADADVPTGSLAVTSTPVQGATIEIDGSPSGQATDYTFPSLATGAHSVLLSLAGRLQVSDTGELYQPVETNVTTDGAAVNIVLYYDLTRQWQLTELNGSPVTDGEIVNVTMRGYESGLETFCPTTSVWANGFDPLGTLCLEADDSLSLCKDHAAECGGTYATGTISGDGRQVEVDAYLPSFCPACDQHFVYTKQ